MFKWISCLTIANLILCHSSFLFAEENIRFEVARGSEIMRYAQDIIKLSDTYYSQYPYLYEGTQSDEEFYLRLYGRWPDGRLVMAFDQDKPIGYAIGGSMRDILVGHESLVTSGYDINSLYILGEIVLLEPYRGRKIGTRMVQQIESFAKDEIHCEKICLMQIDEACVSTLEPENYRPVDGFWVKLGYEPHRELRLRLDWRNVGESQESSHSLFYWIKALSDEVNQGS